MVNLRMRHLSGICRPENAAAAPSYATISPRDASLERGLGHTERMARPTIQEAAGGSFDDQVGAVLSPACVAQFKLDRLLELRAVIDSVRRERERELLFGARAQALRHS
jgi:hypothetical protein